MDEQVNVKNDSDAQSRAGEAGTNLTDWLAVTLENMERKAFEKWCRENNGSPVRLKGTDQYIVPVVQGAWSAWKGRAALQRPCRGVEHAGCSYLTPCGSICGKCGQST